MLSAFSSKAPWQTLFGFIALFAIVATPAPASAQGPISVADLAEKLSGAVVNISTTQKVKQTARNNQRNQVPNLPENSPFRDFFKDFFDSQPGQPGQQRKPRRPRRANSLGSGFVVDAEGIVITNNHVIADAEEITVNFADGSKLPAELIGRDSKTDIAVLKVKPTKPLQAVEFGDSKVLRVGDWVMAIGNPFGLGGSVTLGIVSARNRDINAGPYDDFIQTDAAINRGNSGGPLFSQTGEVIGVNTAIFSPSGGNVGIGFAIPSNQAQSVVNDLIDDGSVDRGWLGVSIQPVTSEIADAIGLDDVSGALVAEVVADGPADDSDLRRGDVILRFGKTSIGTVRDLTRTVAGTDPGTRTEVLIFRRGEERTITVETGRFPT